MGIFTKRNSITNASDATLVMCSLGGDRAAFCAIVARYQSLLCSIAYSAVGDIKHSEDLAQEAFVDAWKTLDTLRDPEKLKSWLCGILRFKASHHRRKERQQPVKDAEQLAEHQLNPSENSAMEQQAIEQQQQTLLWKALDGMDDTYREPLVLFYREEQSIERVAAALDISEDTAKQRLSRGRKILKRAMITLVEGALTKSKPGVAFTAAVMTVISGIPAPAKAAVLGAGAAKTGSVFKAAGVLAALAAFSGLVSSYFGLRAGLDQSRTQGERRLVIKVVVLFISLALLYVAGMIGCKSLALSYSTYQGAYTIASQLLVVGLAGGYLWLTGRMFVALATLRAQERIFNPQAFTRAVDQPNAKQREYKSALKLFGAPLLHFQFGMPEVTDKPAFGWIAGGSRAHGLLFAWGGVAIAPFSVGIVSVGVISIGAVGFGLLGLGTVAVGYIGFGASAVAYKAYGSMSALGWHSAFSGGFSVAWDAAIGPIAYAEQVNNQPAAELMHLGLFGVTYQWLLAAIGLFVIVPAVWHARKVRQRMKQTDEPPFSSR